MDLIPLGGSFEKEYSYIPPELPFNITPNDIITIYPSYNGAPSYAEWDNMLGGKGW
ncbi:hypothetical protein P4H65_20535 [Paenibacillus chitinolyticus]|nr:hypothetical protein [Paenibacillus chitinolyticus]MEC0248188.1 hypothetical protein [Paenibacillus chitinolyticus]